MKLLSVTGTTFNKLKQLVVKAWNGGSYTATAEETSPYGVDSNPIPKMIAVYARTEADGDEVIIGYINKNRLAEQGELRLFSTDNNGTLKTYAWLKKDGTIELRGNVHNAVRYAPLNTGLQNQVNLINAELTKIATAINGIVPGAYAVAQISLNITQSKIDEIKTS